MRIKEPKEKRVKEIIDAAVNEFIEKGYEGASMDSIAKRAGLSKGGLYHHFGSKDEIMLAANQVYFEPMKKLMNKVLKNPGAIDGLKTFIHSYLKHWAKHPKELVFTFLSLSKMVAQAVLWKEMEYYFEGMVLFYESLLIKGIESGEFRTHDTKSRAVILFSSIDGILAYLIMNKTLTVEKASEYFNELFINDIIIKKK
jgi:AcrR family transcriptional regulator